MDKELEMDINVEMLADEYPENIDGGWETNILYEI